MSSAHPSAAPATLKWFSHTDRGKRKNNEDSFVCARFDAHEVHRLRRIGEGSNEAHDYAFAVSDGMGGAHAGEFASRIAIEKITMLLPKSFQQSALGLEAGFADVLEELYAQIHRALAYVGGSYEETRGMEATLSLCWFTPGWMYFGHIGDSRIYSIPANGPMKQLSHDDTHVGWLFRNGHINEREARSHPRRNVLQKSLGGSSQFVDPQVGAVAYEPGDKFLVCSDGLTEGLFNGTLEELIRSPDLFAHGVNPAERLVKESVERDGRDNTTAVVISIA